MKCTWLRVSVALHAAIERTACNGSRLGSSTELVYVAHVGFVAVLGRGTGDRAAAEDIMRDP